MEFVGIDLHQKHCVACVLNEDGDIVRQMQFATTERAFEREFGGIPKARICIEAGGSSPWIELRLTKAGHEVVVA